MRRTSLAIGLVLLISLSTFAEIPVQISDEAFWKMVSDFSEPSGYFRFENFLSNELGYQVVIPTLKDKTKTGGVYLGVGPEQNFTYLVALEPKIAFIIDIRRQNMLEHMMYKALFELSKDRADFLSLLYARPRPAGLDNESTSDALFEAYAKVAADPALAEQNIQVIKNVLTRNHHFDIAPEDQDTIAYVYRVFVDSGPALDYSVGGFGGAGGTPSYADLMVATDEAGRERSYLASEDNFRFIREMHRKNLIVPVVGDFSGPKALRAVGQYLKEHDVTLTAFYTSNVEQYLFDSSATWRRFYNNVAELPMDASSTFIRSVNRSAYPGRRSRNNFDSVLASVMETIKAFQDGLIRQYFDVIGMSY